MYEITDDAVSGHALATRWGVRPQLLREIARVVLPGGQKKGQREQFVLGAEEQRALRAALEAVDQASKRFGAGRR